MKNLRDKGKFDEQFPTEITATKIHKRRIFAIAIHQTDDVWNALEIVHEKEKNY